MISDNSYLWALKIERNERLHIYVQHGKSCILEKVNSINDLGVIFDSNVNLKIIWLKK